MRTFNPFALLFAIAFAFVIGGSFVGCQPQPANAEVPEQLTASAESYFIDPEPYDPCKDPLQKFELSEEGKQRRQQCGVNQ